MTDRPAPPQVGQVLTEIAADMERDINAFEGQPFNGKTVQTQFGNHAAAIAALANIVRDWEGEITALEERVRALEKAEAYLDSRHVETRVDIQSHHQRLVRLEAKQERIELSEEPQRAPCPGAERRWFHTYSGPAQHRGRITHVQSQWVECFDEKCRVNEHAIFAIVEYSPRPRGSPLLPADLEKLNG